MEPTNEARPGPDPDPDLERRLEEIIAACIEADSRGDHDAIVALLKAHPDLADQARAQLDDLARVGLLDDQPREIGPYRILEPLGRGGMGAVYLAEQRSPVHRRVAIKLVKRGMDTHEVLARFGAERQALALMNHPNIAKVFDAGSTGDGRPYFVMEHVAGIPITEYCDRKSLNTRARLDLLLQVCDGVQHAHLKGVVHRDLKPSNLLVAEQDGEAIAKIIDFGIAKATDQRLGDATLHTEHGVVLGTPEYMSPEQAGRDALDVDLRTDVYSLGVIAYELLSGVLPFPSERLRTDPAGLQRILREVEPESPSRRLATRSGETTLHARRRGTTVDDLVRSLRGDLDWICMKALEKDRERRYATVNEFAADVRRHLANEPVLAGPPSRWYRLSKFIRRNRIQVTAAAVVLLALVGGLAASLWFYGRAVDAANLAEKARDRETSARRSAESDFDMALSAVDTMLTRVADKRLFGMPRMDGVRREMLVEAEQFYHRLLQTHGDDPRTRFQAASAKVVLAGLATSLGKTDEGVANARAAVDELERLAVDDRDSRRIEQALAKAQDVLGQSLTEVGRSDEAIAAFRAALEKRRALFAGNPSDRTCRLELIGSLVNFAFAIRKPDPSQSGKSYAEATRLLDDMRVEGRVDPYIERMLAVIGGGHAGALFAQRDVKGAEQQLEMAKASLARLDLDDTFDVDLLEAAADVHRKLGVIFYTTGRLQPAVEAGQAEVVAMQRMVRDYPEVPGYRATLASAYGNLAVFRSAIRMDDEVRAAFRNAVEEFDELSRRNPEVEEFQSSLALHAGNLAHALVLGARRESLAEARRWCERALGILRDLRKRRGDDPQLDGRIASNLVHLTDIASGDGRFDDAQRAAEEAVEVARRARSAHPEQHTLDSTLVSSVISLASCRLAIATIAGERPTGVREVLDSTRAVADADLARTPEDPDVRSDRMLFARLDGLVRAAEGDVVAARAAADEVLHLAAEGDWHGRLARGEILARARAGVGSRDPTDAALAADAESAMRDAVRGIEADLALDPDQPDVRRQLDCARITIAELVAARGGADEAIELLAPSIEDLRSARAPLHVDADSDASLAKALTLRAELALWRNDTASARGAAEALASEFATERPRLAAAALLARADQPQRALDLLEDCARHPSAEFDKALDDASFEKIRAEPRFAGLRSRKSR